MVRSEQAARNCIGRTSRGRQESKKIQEECAARRISTRAFRQKLLSRAMVFSRLCLVAVVLGSCPALLAASAKKQPARPAKDPAAYRGAIVMDAASGNVLFEDRADIVSPPASMTKLMTFAVLYDRLAAGALTLATPVKVTDEDSKMGGTQVFLDPRETFPVEELIFAMMIQSANDASYALARTAAGSADAFVQLMNAKAASLGMKNTTFRTPHGLPPANRKTADGDLTSPRDFALLCRHLVVNTDVLKYTSVRNRAFGQGVRREPMAMTNHNHLVGKVEGVDGLKTGFTNGAGFCLSATAGRKGRRVIVVTMGSEQAKARDLAVTELLERGFAALPAVAASAPTPPAATAASPAAGAEPVVKPAPRPAATTSSIPPAAEAPIKFSVPKR
jgi:D-alanyl-D-alanine carboxypeptidase (penicillin-binding protein 5/6)